MHLKAWFHRHRPSGVVGAFMAFFIVAYVIITRLDATDKSSDAPGRQSAPRPNANVVRTRINTIPAKIIQDFGQDKQNPKSVTVNYDFYDDTGNITDYADYPDAPLSSREHDKMLNLDLRQSSGEIKKNWNTFLTANNSKISKKNVIYTKDLLPSKQNKTAAVSSNHKLIHVYNAFQESAKQRNSISSNQCILLKTHHGNAPICIHDPDDDEIISGRLSKEGIWEGNYLYIVGSILSKEKDLHVLDLGCNIGVYTIFSAKLRHRVVALDPNKINLRLLTKSLNMGGLTRFVTLLWNAISDRRENVTLYDTVGNIGGTFIETADDKVDMGVDEDHKAIAVTLDDLIPFFKGKSVFIKIDVETYELKALQGGEQFFKQVNVRYVLMEWIYHREFDSGKRVIAFMAKQGLYPHVNAHYNTKLEPQNYRSWPDNVLWIKY